MRLTAKPRPAPLNEGMASQLGLELKVLMQRREGTTAVLNQVNASIEAIEAAFGQDAATILKERFPS
jgi:hypothetical protein